MKTKTLRKVLSSALSKEQRAEVKNDQLTYSDRAITDMKQVVKIKEELINSGYKEGQDFRIDYDEIITKTKTTGFTIIENGESKYVEHQFSYNYYAGRIILMWKDVTQTYESMDDQSHVTPDNPQGWHIWDNEGEISLSNRYASSYDYAGKYGNYETPLTINGNSYGMEFCKNYRNLRATTYLKRMRKRTSEAADKLAEKLQAEKDYSEKKLKIAKAEKELTARIKSVFGNDGKVTISDYSYQLEIYFKDTSYGGDMIFITYDPDNDYKMKIDKVSNKYGLIEWEKLNDLEGNFVEI